MVENLMDNLVVQRLKTVNFGDENVGKQMRLLKCVNKFIKLLKKSFRPLFEDTAQNFRIWLVNLGNNPDRNAVYNFCVQRKQPLEFYLRFFKSDTRKLMRKSHFT